MGNLSAPEFRVWIALCLQNQHWANGTGKLCRSVTKEFHLGSQRVVTAATKTLIKTKHIVQTRIAVQRKCALYGVTHLPLNTDKMAEEGLSDAEIQAAMRRRTEAVSDSNRGSASSDTTSEAQNVEIDNRGSARPSNQPLALPKTGGFAPKSGSQRYHRGTRLRSLPSAPAIPGSASPSKSESAHPPSPAPIHESSPRQVRIAGPLVDDRIRKLRKHLAADPTADDGKLAAMYGCSDAEVQQARAHA